MWTLLAVLLPLQAEPAPLPPVPPWGGETRALVVAADDPWITPAEESGLTRTPGYDETFAWLEQLVVEAPELELVTLGTSHEGRAIRMLIASLEGAASAEELEATGRPTLLVQAGIHAGEIDGKDAGLMLLRDLTVGARRRELLEGANLLFVPILNVDGHERVSPHGRINQRGPERMLAADPELAAAFERALEEDEALAADPRARLEWLYRRSPWHDAEYGLYPVGRER